MCSCVCVEESALTRCRTVGLCVSPPSLSLLPTLLCSDGFFFLFVPPTFSISVNGAAGCCLQHLGIVHLQRHAGPHPSPKHAALSDNIRIRLQSEYMCEWGFCVAGFSDLGCFMSRCLKMVSVQLGQLTSINSKYFHRSAVNV